MSKSPKGMSAGSYRSVGTTHDGVRILAPKTKPTHFTTNEIRRTIAKVLRESGADPVPPPDETSAKTRAKRVP